MNAARKFSRSKEKDAGRNEAMSIFLDFKFSNQQDLDDYTAWVKAHPDASGEQVIAHARSHGAIDGGVEWNGVSATEGK